MKSSYDAGADAAYFQFSRLPVHEQERVDDARIIDLAVDGRVVGVEILSPSRGVDLAGLPHATEIARALRHRGFRVLTSPGGTPVDQGPG